MMPNFLSKQLGDNRVMNLQDWLAHCERLHPVAIDMGLERVREVARRMGLRLIMPVVTVAGTNGKGSTCAMLESILGQAGYRTAVYSSPHLVHFVERCRLDGESVSDSQLLPHFQAVEQARGETGLTYFEFTTLAILSCIAASGADVAILEVGLGGRLDAVNIIDADVAVITSIDLDHMDFLGPDRESIGREKAGIMRSRHCVVVSDPLPPQSVLDQARELGADLRRNGVDFVVQGDNQQWSWHGRAKRYSGLAYPALRGANQLINAAGVLAALEALHQRLPVTAQAVRNGLAMVELPGRFQMVPGQPTLVLDVAHNPHAAAVLFQNLDAMGFYPRTHLIFGAMADKDIAAILARMAPLADAWYFCDLPAARASTARQLAEIWAQTPGHLPQGVVSTHSDPRQALSSAIAQANPADRIVVFGSFLTVGGVLQHGLPRLDAPHLN
jgi:dihydrofolate synthase/folylpolyglutamate synthase